MVIVGAYYENKGAARFKYVKVVDLLGEVVFYKKGILRRARRKPGSDKIKIWAEAYRVDINVFQEKYQLIDLSEVKEI